MADVNIQIKQKNGAIWDSLYPRTKAELVIETPTKKFITEEERTLWNSKQAALGFMPENVSKKGVSGGYASLGSDGKIPTEQLPQIAIVDTFVVNSQVEQLTLTVQKGDIAIREDLSKTFINVSGNNVSMSDWHELLTPLDTVSSVNGKKGVVTLSSTDISEGNKLYYTEARVSANTSVKANTAHSTSPHAPSNAQKNSDITKAEIEAKLTGVISTHTHAAGTPTKHASTHITGGGDVIPNVVSGGASGLLTGLDKKKLDDLTVTHLSSVAPISAQSGDIWYEIL